MGNNSVLKFIFRLSRFPVYRRSVLGRFYCTNKPGSTILKEWTTPDSRNTSSTTNLEEEEIVDASRNDGNASMPEQVKRPNPWRKMIMMIIIILILKKVSFTFTSRSSRLCFLRVLLLAWGFQTSIFLLPPCELISNLRPEHCVIDFRRQPLGK